MDRLGEFLEKCLGVVAQLLEWVGRVEDLFTLLLVTALAFFIGQGSGLKLFSGRVKEQFRKSG